MGGIPLNIPIPVESATINYNFTDIMARTGYVTFYPTLTWETNAAAYTLTTNSNVGSNSELGAEILNTSYGGTYSANAISINFDYTFKTTQRIGGVALISMAYATATTGNGTATLTAKIYKNAGQLGTTATYTKTYNSTSSLQVNNTASMQINLADTTFAVNDVLRLTITITDNGPKNTIFHDPVGRTCTDLDGTSLTQTRSILNLPFRITI